jgi:hypothetical protein
MFLASGALYAQSEKETVPEDAAKLSEPYDSINWIDLNRKEEEKNEGWYQRFRGVMFRERTKKSLTGDDITVIETLEVGQGEPTDDCVNIIKIQK